MALKRVTWNVDIADLAYDPRREVQAYSSVPKHKNIVSLLDHDISPDCVLLVMELCDSGDLEQFFIKRSPATGERLDLMEQASCGLLHLHSQTPMVVHRDIKPQNLLLCSDGQRIILKLADFGFARLVEGSRLNTFCGTPDYIAPEVLPKNENVSYTRECDIFSLGLVFQAMARFKPGDRGLKPVLGGCNNWHKACKNAAVVLLLNSLCFQATTLGHEPCNQTQVQEENKH